MGLTLRLEETGAVGPGGNLGSQLNPGGLLSIMGLHNTRLRRNEGHSRAEPVHERGYLQCDSMPMVR